MPHTQFWMECPMPILSECKSAFAQNSSAVSCVVHPEHVCFLCCNVYHAPFVCCRCTPCLTESRLKGKIMKLWIPQKLKAAQARLCIATCPNRKTINTPARIRSLLMKAILQRCNCMLSMTTQVKNTKARQLESSNYQVHHSALQH